MRTYIVIARDWVEEKLRTLCGRISPARRNLVVLVMFGLFAVMALFIFGHAIYQIGKHDGAKISIQNIKILELKENGNEGKTE